MTSTTTVATTTTTPAPAAKTFPALAPAKEGEGEGETYGRLSPTQGDRVKVQRLDTPHPASRPTGVTLLSTAVTTPAAGAEKKRGITEVDARPRGAAGPMPAAEVAGMKAKEHEEAESAARRSADAKEAELERLRRQAQELQTRSEQLIAEAAEDRRRVAAAAREMEKIQKVSALAAAPLDRLILVFLTLRLTFLSFLRVLG